LEKFKMVSKMAVQIRKLHH